MPARITASKFKALSVGAGALSPPYGARNRIPPGPELIPACRGAWVAHPGRLRGIRPRFVWEVRRDAPVFGVQVPDPPSHALPDPEKGSANRR